MAKKTEPWSRGAAAILIRWAVPERAGPAHGDGSSVLWMYHSHFVEPKDMNTQGSSAQSLSQPAVGARRTGHLRMLISEFVTAFALFNEFDSWSLLRS